MSFRQIIAVVALVLLAVFAIQNLQATSLTFIAWEAEVSVALLILLSYIIGGLTVMPILKFFVSKKKSN